MEVERLGQSESPVPVPVLLRYRNREIRAADLDSLRLLLAQHGQVGRKAFPRMVCQAWGWRQANGALSECACRDLLLHLEQRGDIVLPARRHAPACRRQLPVLPLDLIPLVGLDVHDPQADLDQVVVRPIAREERLGWRLFMARYHYLGYRAPIGEHLLYAAVLDEELVALLGWAAAALHAPLRERYIGWDQQTKRQRLHLVVNNVRFLVLPWVRVHNLASKVLAANLRRLSADWEQRYGHPVYLAETFVDSTRFRGTCYRAANWMYLGQTAGRSKQGNAYVRTGTPKALYVFPLHSKARQRLCGSG
jgi:hypothetical protein